MAMLSPISVEHGHPQQINKPPRVGEALSLLLCSVPFLHSLLTSLSPSEGARDRGTHASSPPSIRSAKTGHPRFFGLPPLCLTRRTPTIGNSRGSGGPKVRFLSLPVV